MSAPAPMIERTPDGVLRYNLHPGQDRAYSSPKRFIVVLAGLQSGKTSLGPLWLWSEMKAKGPGDYLVAAPTFPLMEMKLVPEFKRLFVRDLSAGTYQSSPVRVFHLNTRGELMLWGKPQDEPTRVIFGFGADPDSLESATAKAALLDEAGQKKFKRDSWVSVQGRLSLHQGRVFIATTPYTLGWLKSELYDPWKASRDAGGDHSDIEVVNFRSIDNPVFSRDEYERMRQILPGWLFRMRYEGLFERPAGSIYDCWSETENVMPWFPIPDHWPRLAGLDFGGVNTASLLIAKELTTEGAPTGRYIGYREYHAGGRTAKGHVDALLAGEPMIPTAVGGSRSEGQWRDEFAAAGLGVWPPDQADVEVGIQRMYGMIQTRRFVVLDTLKDFIDQVQSYSRVLDDRGEPTEKIEDKETYHLLDAGRYILGWLAAGLDGGWVA